MKKSFFARSSILLFSAIIFLVPQFSSAAFTSIGDITSAPTVKENTVLIQCSNADVQLKLCGHDIVQVWCDETKKFTRTDPKWYESGSFAVSNEKLGGPGTVSSSDKGDYYEILTDVLSIRCKKSPFRISFHDKSGNLICADDDKGMGWDTGTKELRCWKKRQSKENYFGLGQALKGLNKTGDYVINWNTDMGGGNGPLAELSCERDGNFYTTNPFFISTKGYGIFFDNSAMSRFDMGKTDSNYIYFGTNAPFAAGKMIYYFIYGPNLKKVITRYTDLTGKSFLPPRWALGNMQSKWGYNQGHIEYKDNSISWNYRKKEIPCDVMIADIEWYACKCAPIGWSGSNFPDPKRMIKSLDDNNFKMFLISDPNVSDNESKCAPTYAEGKDNKFFARNGSGGVATVGWPWGSNSGLVDFFNESACKWWGKLHYPRMDEGIDGWWIDMNEPARYTTDMRFYRSKDDYLGEIKELHNVYGLANSRATYNWLRDYFDNVAKNNKRPFVLSRAGYSGQQKYVTTWSGDTWRDFKWLGIQVYQAMSIGICGFPLFAHDVGGFWNKNEHDPVLQSRWIQFAAFSPICRFHHQGETHNEPWTTGSETEEIARKYIRLRYRLKPYIYSEIAKSAVFGTGLPLMKALFLEYQDDTKTYNQDAEYLFGPHMLVAPVITSQNSRSIYLPKDKWIDYWDGTIHDGSKEISSYSAPRDKLPIFIRAGAIIPMYPVMNYEGEKAIDMVTIDAYPNGKSCDTLYEDQGETHAYQKGEYATTVINLDGQITGGGSVFLNVGATKGSYSGMPKSRSYMAIIHYQEKPKSVFLNTQQLQSVSDTTALQNAASGWCFLSNDRKGTVRVKTPAISSSTPFSVSINEPGTGVTITGVIPPKLYNFTSTGNGIQIKFFTEGKHSLGIFTLDGKQVFSFSGKGPVESHFVTKNKGSGIYLAKIKTDGKMDFRRIVTK